MAEHPFSRRRPLVIAFEGWNDAGEAASAAVRRMRDHLDVEKLTELDPEEYFDYQFTRPIIATGADGVRRISWPGVAFYGPPTGEDGIHLILGTEPSRSWKTFAGQILDIVTALDIDFVVMLGAMLADVPHSRPIATYATSENAHVCARFRIERSQYEGPVGILSVLAEAFEQAGIPTVSIWASVPHYVHNSPSPKATLALTDRLQEFIDVDLPRDDLVEDALAWETGIDQLAEDDDEMASYIETLERARDSVDATEMSGEAIAEEFERYLRRRGERDL